MTINVWLKQVMKKQQKMNTHQLWEKMQQEEPTLAKKVKKQSGKSSPIAYLGRHILKPLSEEHWLTRDGKDWVICLPENHCAYCLRSVDDVYVIDANDHLYCGLDCLDDDEEADPIEDGYWDDYAMLVMDFEHYYPEAQRLLKTADFEDEEDRALARELYDDLDEYLGSGDFTTIYMNGGDDGPLAAEMYRMLMCLEEVHEQLLKTISKDFEKQT
ncbi:hypothetical protein [Texcoconibacillus texcoconensis]|uniref:Uncharacterized protein n=1 Tax=Texcoconibacillus texcoconensis TaxID=1095777 RepID=A0A840QM83_9BACI|nr:hypothetical protein [Texcoconibacillus texcoconensis]MBB5172463.1 hypothetical protein [Texcoconibacillus texcoconensis]